MKIILGSQSQGRQSVLTEAGIEYDIMTADIDEKAIRHDDLELLPLLIARAKTEALLPRIKEPTLLITADTVAIFNGELREKPVDAAQAREFLKSYNEKVPVYTSTGVVVTNTRTGKRVEATDRAGCYIKTVPEDIIEQLISSGKTFRWAGGFATEDPLLEPFVVSLIGDATSVRGLPLELTKRLLDQVQG